MNIDMIIDLGLKLYKVVINNKSFYYFTLQ